MRGLAKLGVTTARPTAASTDAVVSAYSTFSFAGGGGRGRGRGSGSLPSTPPIPSRVSGQSDCDGGEDDPFAQTGLGHGRGHPLPSSPFLPSLPSWMSSVKDSLSAGRGRSGPAPPPLDSIDAVPSSLPKKAILFKWEDSAFDPGEKTHTTYADDASSLPQGPFTTFSSVGRGKPRTQAHSDSREKEDNRHLRRRASVQVRRSGAEMSEQKPMGREEAVKKAMEVLARGVQRPRMGGGRGSEEKVMGRGRGIGRGRTVDDSVPDMVAFLGDNADGERLAKRLGEEKMNQLDSGFEEMCKRVLPSPVEDAYLDAIHANNSIEYEPEYLVNFGNPDINDKPPMSLEETLEKARPLLMAYEGIQNHGEWEEAVKDVMERLPAMKELMDMYSGPDRVTAKQQQQNLGRVAKTLPDNVPSSVKMFTDRAVLSLQSNPGWGWDKKYQFMDKLVRNFQQHYK